MWCGRRAGPPLLGDGFLGDGVDRGGGIVQDQHGWVGHQGASQGHSLTLASREIGGVVGDGSVESVGVSGDQVLGGGGRQSFQEQGVLCGALVLALVLLPVGGGADQVGTQGAFEEHTAVLFDQNGRPQRVEVDLRHRCPTDADGVLGVLGATGEEVDQCLGVTGVGGEHPDELSLGHPQVDTVERAVGRLVEFHGGHGIGKDTRQEAITGGDGVGCVEESDQALRGGACGRKHLPGHPDPLYRFDEELGQADHDDEFADGEVPSQGHPPGGTGHTGQEHGPRGGDQALVQTVAGRGADGGGQGSVTGRSVTQGGVVSGTDAHEYS